MLTCILGDLRALKTLAGREASAPNGAGGVNVNFPLTAKGFGFLAAAIHCGSRNVVAELLARGAEIDSRVTYMKVPDHTSTSLYHAYSAEKWSIAKLLVSAGARGTPEQLAKVASEPDVPVATSGGQVGGSTLTTSLEKCIETVKTVETYASTAKVNREGHPVIKRCQIMCKLLATQPISPEWNENIDELIAAVASIESEFTPTALTKVANDMNIIDAVLRIVPGYALGPKVDILIAELRKVAKELNM